MFKLFFRKRDRIIQLSNQNWLLKQQVERQNFSYQLTIPIITTKRGIEEVRFSGTAEAIEELQKTLDFKGKKRGDGDGYAFGGDGYMTPQDIVRRQE